MSRPYDDADDLQEREIYLRDRGVDHEEIYGEHSDLFGTACQKCGEDFGEHRASDNACPESTTIWGGNGGRRTVRSFHDTNKFQKPFSPHS